MSVVVKRFRTLGQLRQVDPDRVVSSEHSLVKPASLKEEKGSSLTAMTRNPRTDKKHQYPLRMMLPLWSKITDLNLNCQGLESGPSLNETLCDLLEVALADEGIVERLKNKFPDRNQIVIVRSWESV